MDQVRVRTGRWQGMVQSEGSTILSVALLVSIGFLFQKMSTHLDLEAMGIKLLVTVNEAEGVSKRRKHAFANVVAASRLVRSA